MAFSLTDLEARVAARADADPAESHTARLLARGVEKCAQKMGEEAVETVIAATARDRAGTISETADLVYHLMVLLKAAEVPLDEVMAELERRTAQSGIAEKAARPATGDER